MTEPETIQQASMHLAWLDKYMPEAAKALHLGEIVRLCSDPDLWGKIPASQREAVHDLMKQALVVLSGKGQAA